MNKQIFVIILVAIGLSAFLYSRPKFVVKSEAAANRDKPTTAQNSSEAQTSKSDNEDHAIQLPEKQRSQVEGLKNQLKQANGKQKQGIYEQLALVFASVNAADSAAFYFEQIALMAPSVENWIRTGDAYFQAYSLALKPQNIERLTKKTQDAYGKVLVIKPNDLHARTNLAMTYVTSASPMQAISMLRQVIEDAPDYEPALLNLGALSLQSRQFDKAASRFQQVLSKNPENINAQMGLAYSYIELEKIQDAKKLLENVLKKDLDPNLRQEVTNTLQSLK